MSKQIVNAEKRFAVAASGSLAVYQMTYEALSDVDLDEARDRAPDLMRAIHEALSRQEGRVGGPHAGLVFGGYSEREGRFAAYAVRTADDSLCPGSKAFEPIEVALFTAPEMVADDKPVVFDAATVIAAIAQHGVHGFCRQVMEGQRAGARHALESALQGQPLIGGACEVTTISEYGVTTERVAEWQDTVGDRYEDLSDAPSLALA
ncbi:hypothetical protein [Chenggangzhangella methanolivorans]|uniref:Uncharacterized protein n=1 Tax=Chenggangzhangella methanolivorans TaxID=1437009 RepID=A0A9E6RCI7_9HYPH|nr:hypothetical protein [Chenggangzhangella methanolivorans]QZN98550.1 hypothetical protein K6K41_16060 [Chenggangzhangella methanolivorans]